MHHARPVTIHEANYMKNVYLLQESGEDQETEDSDSEFDE
jgi:hypothetical protein